MYVFDTFEEVSDWQRVDSPITRFRKYLEQRGIWNEEEEVNFKKSMRMDVLRAFSSAEKIAKPSLEEMFTDVYGNNEMPWNLQDQEKELKGLIDRYPVEYSTTGYKK